MDGEYETVMPESAQKNGRAEERVQTTPERL